VRRAGLAATAAIGAFAVAPTAAQAANFDVNTLSDAAADGCTTAPNGCTLRDAITDAGANTESDLITFQSGLTGELELTQGQLQTGTANVDDLTIQGPGAGAITISGDPDNNGPDSGDSRILQVSAPSGPTDGTSVAISGLTLSGGFPVSGNGGAISLGKYTHLALDHTTITGNATAAGSGGAIGTPSSKYTEMTIVDSTISGNSAQGGGAIATVGPLTIHNTTLSGNHATAGSGGAVLFGQKYGPLNVTDSVISGNSASATGGAISSTPSTGPRYGPADHQIVNTTVSGNTATSDGGAFLLGGLSSDQGSFTIDHSTISGNNAGSSNYGGGIQIVGTVNGSLRTIDSTISGNSAGAGGGVGFPGGGGPYQVGPNGSISFDNSTISSNTATNNGGGFYLGYYGPSGGPYTSGVIHLDSTIVGGNTAASAANDLDRADTSTGGGFDLRFSLVQAPGDGVASQSSSILNQSPQLGGLANNGGPTLTQLPAMSSPAIDAGRNPFGLSTDQRGQPRTVDEPPANIADGTDIGAVERQEGAPVPAKHKKKCKKKKHKKKRSAESSKKKHKKHKKCKKKKKKKKKH
jgi:hypothetical protein